MAIMMDVKGPEIRTGTLEEPIHLKAGSVAAISYRRRTAVYHDGDVPSVSVNYPDLPRDVRGRCDRPGRQWPASAESLGEGSDSNPLRSADAGTAWARVATSICPGSM